MRFRMLAAMTLMMLSLGMAVPALAQEGASPDSVRAGSRAARLEPKPRTGWMFGMGAGYGIAGPMAIGTGDPEPGGPFQMRVGAGISPHSLVGIEYLSWSGSPTDSTTWNMTAVGPALTWFYRKNLYVRGMVGWAQAKAPYELGTGPSHTFVQIHDDGFAFMGSAGWEWRYRRSFGVAPEVQYLHVTMEREEAFHTASGSLSLNLYY